MKRTAAAPPPPPQPNQIPSRPRPPVPPPPAPNSIPSRAQQFTPQTAAPPPTSTAYAGYSYNPTGAAATASTGYSAYGSATGTSSAYGPPATSYAQPATAAYGPSTSTYGASTAAASSYSVHGSYSYGGYGGYGSYGVGQASVPWMGYSSRPPPPPSRPAAPTPPPRPQAPPPPMAPAASTGRGPSPSFAGSGGMKQLGAMKFQRGGFLGKTSPQARQSNQAASRLPAFQQPPSPQDTRRPSASRSSSRFSDKGRPKKRSPRWDKGKRSYSRGRSISRSRSRSRSRSYSRSPSRSYSRSRSYSYSSRSRSRSRSPSWSRSYSRSRSRSPSPGRNNKRKMSQLDFLRKRQRQGDLPQQSVEFIPLEQGKKTKAGKQAASKVLTKKQLEEAKKRAARAARFGNQGKKGKQGKKKSTYGGPGTQVSQQAWVQMKGKYRYEPTISGASVKIAEHLELASMRVKGTCQTLEKRYLRLTTAPDPAEVRPLEVLQRAFTKFVEQWKEGEVTYLFVWEQLKSIRQDLLVQGIKNAFTVRVYETHARIALQNDDLNEFNQCQTQLSMLYDQGIEGNVVEFIAYRILYLTHTKAWKELIGYLPKLSPSLLRAEAIRHAMSVQSAVSTGNYYAFHRLRKDPPNLNGLFMELLMENEQRETLKKVITGYKPNVSVEHLCTLLGGLELSECTEVLDGFGVVYVDETTKDAVDTRKTVLR